jgi:TonB family protein
MTVHQWLADWSSWGWPLFANHLWQATLISFVAFAAAGLLRNGPGRARYAVWIIASVRFALPSTLLVSIAHFLGIDFSSLLPSKSVSGAGATSIVQLTAPITQLDESVSVGTHAARGHDELLCAITVAWLAGSIVLLALWLRRRRRFRSAMRATRAAQDSREQQALNRVRAWLQIKRDVRLSILRGTVEPGVWGVWRPIVFLPERMADDLSEAEIEAVMMHEMVHVARWDNLTANLHRLLCCVLWFHPVVWALDRLLLAERERACDEEVIRLGGTPDVYASSLLKVLRFCLGWSVAGASNATGSNLVRRVERIMSRNVQVNLTVWHRTAIGSIAALVMVLSMAPGLLTREEVRAQSRKPPEGVVGGIPGGVPGGIPGTGPGGVPGGIPGEGPDGVPGGIPGGIRGGVAGFVLEEQDKLIERLDQAREVAIEFRNSAKTPLVITDAKVKAVLRENDVPGDEFAVVPIITLVNNIDRRIRGYTLEFRNGLERSSYYEAASGFIAPRGSHTSGAQRRFLILVGGPNGWTVRVAGVIFEDGDVWGVVPPPPPPPPPPLPLSAEVLKQLEQAPETRLHFDNSDGAPLSITSATARAAKLEPGSIRRGGVDSAPIERWLLKADVRLTNNTSRLITGIAIRFLNEEPNKSYGGTYMESSKLVIEPSASYELGGFGKEGGESSSRLLVVWGNPARMEVKVVGVKFEDGDIWGTLFTPAPTIPPPPPSPRETDASNLIRKSGGAMMTSATHRVEADYPPLARAARISGGVVVEVIVDETGAVASARVISGHPLLKDAAVNAARQWQFSPTTVSGELVRVVGTLTFNFQP